MSDPDFKSGAHLQGVEPVLQQMASMGENIAKLHAQRQPVEPPSAMAQFRAGRAQLDALSASYPDRMEAAVLAGDLDRIARLLTEQSTYMFLHRGLMPIECEAEQILWQRRVDWLTAYETAHAGDPVTPTRPPISLCAQMVDICANMAALSRSLIHLALRGNVQAERDLLQHMEDLRAQSRGVYAILQEWAQSAGVALPAEEGA